MIVLHPGDQLWEYIAGGAGYGDPLERDPELVLADVLDGKITPEAARGAYGVALTPDGDGIDDPATKEARESLRASRGAITWTIDRGADGRHA
jgi:N-methylhydantoinase B